MFIYLISNLVNGKLYVGQTTRTVPKRWKDHLAKARHEGKKYTRNSHLYCAMRKYSPENFKVETLCECPDQDSLNKAEIFFIWFMGTTKRSLGYNSTFGGASGLQTEETKKKHGDASRGRKATPETLKRMSESKKGIPLGPFTPEHCANLSKAAKGKPRLSQRGRKRSPEECAAISRAKMGKSNGPCSERQKQLISLANKGKVLSPDHCEKISIALTGKPKTPEHVANNVASHKEKKRPRPPMSEESRANMSKAAELREAAKKERGYVVSEESRRRMRDSQNNRHRKNREKLMEILKGVSND